MNNLSIVGRVGKDAEVRDAGRNKVVNFSLAWSSPFGEKETTWFNVSLFGERFVKLATYIKKGDQLGVNGEVSLRKYTTKDGDERTSLEINGTNVTLLGGSNRNEGTASGPTASVEDDSIPF